MATISQEKDLEMLKKNADGNYTKYNPHTKATNVKCSNGQSVETQLADNATKTQTAQNTANTAVNNASTAQNTANNALNRANASLPYGGGQLGGILTANSNTSYNVRQVRNIILSPGDADINQMGEGDIWIKYK